MRCNLPNFISSCFVRSETSRPAESNNDAGSAQQPANKTIILPANIESVPLRIYAAPAGHLRSQELQSALRAPSCNTSIRAAAEHVKNAIPLSGLLAGSASESAIVETEMAGTKSGALNSMAESSNAGSGALLCRDKPLWTIGGETVNKRNPATILEKDLGEIVGRGCEKVVHKISGRDNLVICLPHKSTNENRDLLEQRLREEIKCLNQLEEIGFDVVKNYGVVMVNARAGAVMQYVKAMSFTELTLKPIPVIENAIGGLEKIKYLLLNAEYNGSKGIRIKDFDFLIEENGSILIIDPMGIASGSNQAQIEKIIVKQTILRQALQAKPLSTDMAIEFASQNLFS